MSDESILELGIPHFIHQILPLEMQILVLTILLNHFNQILL
jgi:hypothetical protein